MNSKTKEKSQQNQETSVTISFLCFLCSAFSTLNVKKEKNSLKGKYLCKSKCNESCFRVIEVPSFYLQTQGKDKYSNHPSLKGTVLDLTNVFLYHNWLYFPLICANNTLCVYLWKIVVHRFSQTHILLSKFGSIHEFMITIYRINKWSSVKFTHNCTATLDLPLWMLGI